MTNSNSPTHDVNARSSAGFAFSAIFERIGFVESGQIAARAAPKQISDIPIWDVHVPLRCDLAASISVVDNRVTLIELKFPSGTSVVRWEADQKTEGVSAANLDFMESLSEAVQQLIDTGAAPGLVPRPRRIVSPPLWSDGTKEAAFELEAFSGVNAFSRVVLLGPPGSGKSTVARSLAAAHLSPLLEPPRNESPNRMGVWESEARTPIYIECKDLVTWDHFPELGEAPTTTTLLDYIEQVYLNGDSAVARLLESDLQSGRALLVLDGLDEVPIPHGVANATELRRDQIRTLVRSVATRFPATQMIVTSRPAAYSDWSLDGFEVLRLKPMNRTESRRLVARLYAVIGSTEGEAASRADRLLQQLDRIPSALREQPLFVTLLAFMFADSQDQLPTQRGALLEDAIQLLLSRWTERRMDKQSIEELLGCTELELYARLTAIAYRARTAEIVDGAEENRAIPLGVILEELFELGDHVNPTEALTYLSSRSGLLTSPSPRRYKFAHRLFEEYLTAVYLANAKGGLEKLAGLLRANPAHWIEIVLLAGDVLRNDGRRHEQWELLNEVLEFAEGEPTWDMGVWLAGRIAHDQNLANERSKLGEPIVTRFIQCALTVLAGKGECSPEQRADVAEALAEFGDPRPGVGLNHDGHPDICWTTIPGGSATIGTNPAELANLLVQGGIRNWDSTREAPRHAIELGPYEIGKYPVTVKQFQSFVEASDGFDNDEWWSARAISWRDQNGPAPIPRGAKANWPQTFVTWFEADAFARWLGSRADCDVSLPTEAEWEYAARGRSARLFPWGDDQVDNAANWVHCSVRRVVPVGCFDATETAWAADGPNEMIGHVWEWCSSIVQFSDGEVAHYPTHADVGYENDDFSPGTMLATRGGYYGNPAIVARASYRGRDAPEARLARQGFRVVRRCA